MRRIWPGSFPWCRPFLASELLSRAFEYLDLHIENLRLTYSSPLYGGVLAKPQERWPLIFQGEFWATYPYFLPSLVSGCVTLSIFLICVTSMKEVRHLRVCVELARNHAIFSRCHRKRTKLANRKVPQSKMPQEIHGQTTHIPFRC